MTARFRRLALAASVGLASAHPALGEYGIEAFDGSFRLQSGEVVTGGYFVEQGQGRYLYLDVQGLDRGGLFERAGDTLRSVVPPGSIEIEFVADAGGVVDALIWNEAGSEPLRGERIHPHQSRPIRFASADGTRLRGRLLLPSCAGPRPLVVSVHGSGPVDRHGGPYHTFFLQRGVAVLAYDKRGFTTAVGAWREPDLATLSADAAAAARYAAELPDVDRARLGFFGSSQAGWVVPRAALETQAAFIIVRAGAAVSGLETVLHEVRQELRADGLDGIPLDHALALRREIYRSAVAGRDLAATDRLVAPYLDEPWYRTAFGDGPVSELWSARWWRWAQRNLAIAATPDLERFDGQVLWFLAERDENVPLVPTRAALERAFASAPGGDHEIVVLEGALHSFLIPVPDAPPRFSGGFFSRMATWMAERGISDVDCWDSGLSARLDTAQIIED